MMLKVVTLSSLTAATLLLSTGMIDAKRHSYTKATDANGNTATIVRSSKTGATARVGAAYRAKFQAYIDDLENSGATIRFMGGLRRGRCSGRHMHSCGRALDVCQ